MTAPTIQEHLDKLKRVRDAGSRDAELATLKDLITDYYHIGDMSSLESYAQELVLKAKEYRKPEAEMEGQEALARLASEVKHDNRQALFYAKRAYEAALKAQDKWGLDRYKDMIEYYDKQP